MFYLVESQWLLKRDNKGAGAAADECFGELPNVVEYVYNIGNKR